MVVVEKSTESCFTGYSGLNFYEFLFDTGQFFEGETLKEGYHELHELITNAKKDFVKNYSKYFRIPPHGARQDSYLLGDLTVMGILYAARRKLVEYVAEQNLDAPYKDFVKDVFDEFYDEWMHDFNFQANTLFWLRSDT